MFIRHLLVSLSHLFLFLIQRYKKRNKVKEEKETEQFKDSLATERTSPEYSPSVEK